MARATGDQGLPAIRYHALDPQGFRLTAWLVQVGKPVDVVHCTLLLRAAAFTRRRQETLHDCTATSVHLLGLLVEDARPVPLEGSAAKPGDQRRLAFSALVSHLQHPPWALRRCDRGPLLVQDCMHARAMCMRQRRREGEWHHAVHRPQPMDVQGHQGVVHHAPICRLVWRHDAVIRRVETRCHGGRCAVPPGGRALRAENLDRHLHPERAVDAASVVGTALLVIRLLGDDFRAEKACGGRARMGDQGFFLCEGACERVVQERFALAFARCGFLAWATASEQPIVRLPDVP